jgi:uncharacterized small protein (DUF1192 family)
MATAVIVSGVLAMSCSRVTLRDLSSSRLTCPTPAIETRAKSCQTSTNSRLPDQEHAMDWDEQKPRPAKAVTLGDDLSALSVSELEERLVALARETERIKAEIKAKKAHETAAAAIFKR